MNNSTLTNANIVVDPEFAALLPKQSSFEMAELEKSLITEGGATEPLLVWPDKEGKTAVLIDGHTRKMICDRLKLPYTFTERKFKSRNEVRQIMFQRQLGRRNLTAERAAEVRTAYLRLLKGPVRAAAVAAGVKPANAIQTAAKDTGVSPAKIKRDENFVKGLAVVKVADPKLADAISAGTSTVNMASVAALGQGKVKVEAIQTEAKRVHKKDAEKTAVSTANKGKSVVPLKVVQPVTVATSTAVAPTAPVAPDAVERIETQATICEKLSLMLRAKTAKARLAFMRQIVATMAKLDGEEYAMPAEFDTPEPASDAAKPVAEKPVKKPVEAKKAAVAQAAFVD